MKNKNIEEEIIEYFDNQEVPELKNKDALLKAVEMNKERRKIVISKRLTTVACSLCLLLLTILPIIALTYKEPSAPPLIYYGETEANRVDLSLEQTRTYININYPQYNFIFDEYTCNEMIGYYEPNTENLLALHILTNHSALSFITLEVNLIVSEQFIFKEHEAYIVDSEFIQTNEYSLNKVKPNNNFEDFLKAYISYSNHKIYLNFNIYDELLLDKFI